MYELRLMKAAERYFKKLKEKGLKMAYREALDKIAYRIYEEEGHIVVVILAGTRENFYNELKRYMNP
ncbi:hypothetical protein [Clostridium sp. Marseille-P2415]|uniref:hypothetical protein n=1 Tax=Clostridium sp. Marseille-P2415 TaxID=1805471 RepID=UPI0009887AD0|nr:hypothetical protein [Clostridium sp. Marseille-P2415]